MSKGKDLTLDARCDPRCSGLTLAPNAGHLKR